MSTEADNQSSVESQLLGAVGRLGLAADFGAALAVLVDEACRLVPCAGAAVLWLTGDELEVLASQGTLVSWPGLTLPIAQVGAARPVLDTMRAVVIEDTAQDTHWRTVPGEEQVRSWLAAPLVADGLPLGLLEWTAGEPEWFDAEDACLATTFAQYSAPLLYHIQLLDDTRDRLRQLSEPRSRPAPEPDPAAALQRITREAMDLANARHAFAFLIDEGTRRLRCVAASGDARDQIKALVLRGDGTLGDWGMAAPRAARGAGWLGAGVSDRDLMAALGLTKVLILPLRAGREPVGILGVAEPRDGRSFDQATIRLMTHLASQASLVVERTSQTRPATEAYDYEVVFQSSPLGLCVVTAAGGIEACNPALAGLLARADRSLAGRNLSEFLAQPDWRRLRHALEEVSITGQHQQVDTVVESGQGEQRHVRLSLARTPAAGLPDAPGSKLVVVVEDVTTLKILEQERVEHLRELREKHAQLQELDQLRTRFVSNVSHELRTPLAVIKLYATLMRKGRPEKQTYYLQTIEQETHRLETMVENILDLTRIDRHTLRLHPESIAAEEIIAQVLEVYQETAQKRGIELKNHVPGELPRLSADKNDLIQMLTNLVDNALKYTPRGGQVWVAARELSADGRSMLEIAVGDTGIGIPAAEHPRIFERFYRGTNNTAGSTGTGLGLAIVQELMAQHGGQVTLKSQVSQGSVFALQFPLPSPADSGPDKDKEMRS